MKRRGFLKALMGLVFTAPALGSSTFTDEWGTTYEVPTPAPTPKVNSRDRLKDIFLSEEALADLRAWTCVEIDEETRKEIFTTDDSTLSRVYGVQLHDM